MQQHKPLRRIVTGHNEEGRAILAIKIQNQSI